MNHPFDTQTKIHNFLFTQGRKTADNSKLNNLCYNSPYCEPDQVCRCNEYDKELIRNKEGK